MSVECFLYDGVCVPFLLQCIKCTRVSRIKHNLLLSFVVIGLQVTRYRFSSHTCVCNCVCVYVHKNNFLTLNVSRSA